MQIIAAVMTDPIALVLDEPFSGLDPDAVDAMADLLREHNSRGVPVLFSSHQLDLVERLCDTLVILVRGRVVASGTTAQLRSRGRVRHRLVAGSDVGWVRGIDGVSVLEVDGSTAVLELLSDDAADRVLREALARGSVRELSPLVPTLNDVYREVTA